MHWLRRALQWAVFLLFLQLLLSTVQGVSGLPQDLFFRLDPLLGISAILAGRIWIPALTLGGLVLLSALVFGRAWCGWICPLGSLLDWLPARRKRRLSPTLRTLKHLLLLLLLVLTVLGSLALAGLDPIALFWRGLATVLLPALRALTSAAEGALYQVPALNPATDWLDSLLRGPLPLDQPFFLPNLWVLGLMIFVLALNAMHRRFWCLSLCPLGALLAWPSRIALFRRQVEAQACISCGRCRDICPTSAVDSEANFSSDPAECVTCLECREICPTRAIHFPRLQRLAVAKPYDPKRREALGSLGIVATGILLARMIPPVVETQALFVRPPGASESSLASLCFRCGHCVRVCPTGGLQPLSVQGGLEQLWTPVLVSRRGPCSFSCNSCGAVCPTGAIPPLPLAEKQATRIGLAKIDRTRCIPWAEGKECIVCEEVCPVAEKAVKLEQQTVPAADGETTVLRPFVFSDLCIGCGICEQQCPVVGDAAIRVFVR
ncbi:MAG: 4Fe-4S binding protein [Coprothermobacterota bacterium]|nr:4Fe-4S binding protein [Coprothermobacterota bacterium]